jgi:hypothetical protein
MFDTGYSIKRQKDAGYSIKNLKILDPGCSMKGLV